jgi:SAM dependent carboxyl methyltransferase
MADDQRSVSGRMEGHGYYTEHSEAQQAFGALALDWLEQAVAEVAPPAPGLPFVIADFGAAGGGSSLEPMRRALAARAAAGSALVVHTDIPSNDFSALFELVERSPGSYLGTPGVFAYAAGRSFYEQLFPDDFLSLGWSSIAVHWLSRIDVAIPDHIYSPFARGDIRVALQQQSARDWRSFLNHRAQELRSSGRLIVLGGANADDGTSGAEGLMDAANDSLRTLVHAGVLRDSEYRRMTIPTWNRTLAEFVEPFDQDELRGHLELRRRDLRSLPDPFFEVYRTDGDIDRYVGAVVGSFRAAFEESLWATLDSDRDAKARAGIRLAFATELSRHVAANPERCAASWHVVVLDIGAPTN